MSIPALQFGSLSPTVTFSRHPDETVITDEGTFPTPVIVNQVRPFLPVYDNDSDLIIQGIMEAVTRKIERFIRRDTTPRTRQSLYQYPQRIIDIPYGPHSDIVVEQYVNDAWVAVTSPIITGLQRKSIVLEYAYPTRVTCTSGFEQCPSDIVQAILQETAFQYKNRNDPNEVMPETKHGLSIPTVNLLTGYAR